MKKIQNSWRRTKIVCTLGPATHSAEMIGLLMRAGMDVARLNLSHGTMEGHERYVKLIRGIDRETGHHTAIMIDLPGPKYRVGNLTGGKVFLKKGSVVYLTVKEITGNAEIIPVNLPYLPDDVQPGDTILLADGDLELQVEKTQGRDVRCHVVVGGTLLEHKGLVVPGRHISAPYLTDAMKQDLDFAVLQRPDYLALSFVGDAGDVKDVRRILQAKHQDIRLISKIERAEAVDNFNRILAASDAIMVARGDLGVEIPLERVPLVQKEVIRKCNEAGKPVITATEMLESMVGTNRPTRAETTDVANAIFDGTDAVMLSAETSIGKYPEQAATMMSRIAVETEKMLPYERMLSERGTWIAPETDEIISYNAWSTAYRLNARAIVAYTESGSTARRVSKYRPGVAILALTPSEVVFHRLLLCWGVFPFIMKMPSTVNEMFAAAAKAAKDTGLAKTGDLVVITAGIPARQAGSTNMLKVEEIK